MILRIRHADGFRDVGEVQLENGLVKATKFLGKEDYNPIAGMKGWQEKSVREYAMRCNWIVNNVEEPK